ncbi:carbohydrate ABC transporter permease [Albidovulum sediminicola]|uniref:Sugar ABC transporter permease n=1 Tax=Albidovulum sediminicola TaxID=2984331 RepID=A0ABT2Z222_9RHOB|nr:sugar ABC transporter permease [Defluviimonas sp. WL0075]MCV2864811.1 sugar ABC transporter permease [Defluviimonas sp. WL0075]
MTDVSPISANPREVAAQIFRARAHSAEVEARPQSEITNKPRSFNPPMPKRYYYYLMAPAIAILAFISLYPFFWLIVMSLQDVDIGGGEWVGFKNYVKLFSDGRFLDGWWLLAQYSVMCLGLQVGLGVLLAVVVNSSKYEKYLVTALLMPMMMAPAVAGLLWLFLYNGTFGWYHWILQSAGILDNASILASANTAMYAIVLVDVWQWTPLITIIALAGLKRVPRDQLEANMVDGASPLRNFFAITMPNLYPVLLIAVLLRFMDNFRFIDSVLVLTGGGPGSATKILPVYLFEVAFKFFKLGRGAAIALTLLIVTIILGKLLVRVFEKPQNEKG